MSNRTYEQRQADFNYEFPNFDLSELACNDANQTPMPEEFEPNYYKTMKILQWLRYTYELPIIINSGYRTPYYNAHMKKPGSKKSLHSFNASAVDFYFKDGNKRRLRDVFRALDYMQRNGMITAGGLHLYNSGFIHIDSRGVLARWG